MLCIFPLGTHRESLRVRVCETSALEKVTAMRNNGRKNSLVAVGTVGLWDYMICDMISQGVLDLTLSCHLLDNKQMAEVVLGDIQFSANINSTLYLE